MADYEEQARALIDALFVKYGKGSAMDIAVRALRTAAEDATRRERERVAAYIDTEAGCTANPDARARLTCVAHEIRIGVMQHVETTPVGPDPCATPSPPRPAMGEAAKRPCSCNPERIARNGGACNRFDEMNPAVYCKLKAPTPPARTEDAGRCAECERRAAEARATYKVGYLACDACREPPPEPEAARCSYRYKGAQCIKEPKHSPPHVTRQSEQTEAVRCGLMHPREVCELPMGHGGAHVFTRFENDYAEGFKPRAGARCARCGREDCRLRLFEYAAPSEATRVEYENAVRACYANANAEPAPAPTPGEQCNGNGWYSRICYECNDAYSTRDPAAPHPCADCDRDAKVARLVEAARAVLPLLIPVVGEHADHVLCEGCNEYGATADDVKHRDGCRVVKFIAALAGAES